MPFPIDDKERHVIPRWRDSRTTAAIGELDSTRAPIDKPAPDESLVQHKAEEWSAQRSISFASDLVATALSEGIQHRTAHEAAEFLLGNRHASDAARTVARRFLGLERSPANLLEQYPESGTLTAQQRHRRIHTLRRQLRESPRNVLTMADLALEYTAVGRRDRALNTMDVALRLAPENRFLLRSAARLLVHVDDLDGALEILRRAATSKSDPWLIAAEVSISGVASRGSRLAKIGAQLVSADKLSAFHTTELASALGTLEAESGANKKAKQLFRQSLVDPTENSVAQATWAAQKLGFNEFDPQALELPGSFEARALDWLKGGQIQAAIADTWKWHGDQFFSPTAAIFGSYLAGVGLANYGEVLRFVEEGRTANPDEWLLVNNWAFALASLGRLEEAEGVLDSITPSTSDVVRTATLLATKGLILFRQGQTWAGREFYLNAENAFRNKNLPRATALAATFRAREEVVAETPEAESALKAAQEATKTLDSPEILSALRMVEMSFETLRQKQNALG